MVPHVAGANINDFRLNPDDGRGGSKGLEQGDETGEGVRDLLRTQPESPDSTSTTSTMEIEDDQEADQSSLPVAESSTAGQKRLALEDGVKLSLSRSPTSEKRRKVLKPANGTGNRNVDVNGRGKSRGNGKGKGTARGGVDVGKRYQGHAWDCTGVVPRYTDFSEMPPNLVKCRSLPSPTRTFLP